MRVALVVHQTDKTAQTIIELAIMIKSIFIIWFQGVRHMPYIVKRCIASWKLHHPLWNVIVLDNSTISDYVPLHRLHNGKEIEKAHLSDIYRISLLHHHGGLYVDSSVYCTRPADTWLSNHTSKGFFAFNNPPKSAGVHRPISNWLLYGEPDSYITTTLYNKVLEYYASHDKAERYFIFHEIFGDLYNSDIKFKTLWDGTDKFKIIDNWGPWSLSKVYQHNQPVVDSARIKHHLDTKYIPVYKLSYKRYEHEYRNGTWFSYLLDGNTYVLPFIHEHHHV